MIRLFVGMDQREAVAYHTFSQSVIDHVSVPVSFVPVHKRLFKGFDTQRDGSNAFTFSRYLIPYLCGFNGWAIFCDGDMVCDKDIKELWDLKENHVFNTALCVVKHDYETRHPVKYAGTPMQAKNLDYPRKNWSSVILWNCGHFANRALTPDFVSQQTPAFLHRFQWLKDEHIGDLPPQWNYLVSEYPPSSAAIYHHTLGVPGIKNYADHYGSWKWHSSLVRALECAGEDPERMVTRSVARVGSVELDRAV